MISTIHNEYYITAHLFISFIKTMIDTNSYRLLILRLSLVKIVLSNAKSASEWRDHRVYSILLRGRIS